MGLPKRLGFIYLDFRDRSLQGRKTEPTQDIIGIKISGSDIVSNTGAKHGSALVPFLVHKEFDV